MNKIMAHMIPFYPDREKSIQVLRALVDAGVQSLEIQFPFSDPSADGPSIEAACTKALEQGFTVDQGFQFLADTAEYRKGKTTYLMTYTSLLFTRGIESFLKEAKSHGVSGMIVPDLPVDSDEGFYAAAQEIGVHGMPVVVPSMAKDRLDLILALKSPHIYCAVRKGITGVRSSLDAGAISFLQLLKQSGSELNAGFGIQDGEQATMLQPYVDQVIVGSQIVRAIPEEGDVYEPVYAFAKSLVEGTAG
jgi:tryptophan synthase alpha chain